MKVNDLGFLSDRGDRGVFSRESGEHAQRAGYVGFVASRCASLPVVV